MGCDSLAWEELAGLRAGLGTTPQVLAVGQGRGGACGIPTVLVWGRAGARGALLRWGCACKAAQQCDRGLQETVMPQDSLQPLQCLGEWKALPAPSTDLCQLGYMTKSTPLGRAKQPACRATDCIPPCSHPDRPPEALTHGTAPDPHDNGDRPPGAFPHQAAPAVCPGRGGGAALPELQGEPWQAERA